MYIDEQSLEVSASWANLLRKRHPNTGFPNKMSDEAISAFGVSPVRHALLKVLPDGQEYKRCAPQKVDGVWTEVWEISECL